MPGSSNKASASWNLWGTWAVWRKITLSDRLQYSLSKGKNILLQITLTSWGTYVSIRNDLTSTQSNLNDSRKKKSRFLPSSCSLLGTSAPVHGSEVAPSFFPFGQLSPRSRKIRAQYKKYQAGAGWNNCGAHWDLLFLDTPGTMAGPNVFWCGSLKPSASSLLASRVLTPYKVNAKCPL